MPVYEFTFLLKDKEELNNLKTVVTEVSGKIVKEEEWGNKHLAYPINKLLEASFFNWSIELPTDKVAALRGKLRFNERLLRYLLLKVDTKTPAKKAETPKK